ncbi:MAG: tRNA (uridine(34)/cytosine(34)/5-carboxymethylaminomethyluridine(34)-2'-O)-methyltransferase TrmL [Gammaproteobacteria bacterium]|nr:tRNA (uridine(34)/cytosine(34)/5-carboxymethylaminomethyluridine(34)-2'-O)-methyltransferase TrmL [Gammaproteobacteria bacterium]
MFNIVLYQPEIPPNTGNIIRLCANTGCHLHLIEPLGFDLDDKKLRRAGLDYHEWAKVQTHPSLRACTSKLAHSGSIYAISTRGTQSYSEINYSPGDTLIFGPETRGLPQDYLDSLAPENILRLPMLKNSRSLNLSNTAAIVVYEALRQTAFKGLL